MSQAAAADDATSARVQPVEPAAAWPSRLASFKGWILAVTVVYFIAGVVWMSEDAKRRRASAR